MKFTEKELSAIPMITSTVALAQILRERVDYVNLTNASGQPAIVPKAHKAEKSDGSPSKRAGEFFLSINVPLGKEAISLSDGRVLTSSSATANIQFNGAHLPTADEFAAAQAATVPASNKEGVTRKSLADIQL